MLKLRRPGLVLLAAVAALLPAPRASGAAAYDFVVLASSLRPVFPVQTIAPSIDDTGEVAFVAAAAGHAWLLVADEPGKAVLSDYRVIDGGPGHIFEQIGDVPIGRFTAGWVAYRRNVEAAVPGLEYVVARGDGAAVEVIYAGIHPFGLAVAGPAVNAAGRLVLYQSNGVTPRIVAVEDGVETVLFEEDETLADGRTIDALSPPLPDIDAQGRVAFYASFTGDPGTCKDEILLSGGLAPSTIATGGLPPGCLFSFLEIHVPFAANDTRDVAYAGRFEDPIAGRSVDAVFFNSEVVWEERLPGFPSDSRVAAVALNDRDTVAFLLRPGVGASLHVGSDPVADKVIATGDTLCEGTVTALSFHRFGLNDADELAFGVALADGRQLIVRAEPSKGPGGACIRVRDPVPEPGAALAGGAALAALAALAAWRRRYVRVG